MKGQATAAHAEAPRSDPEYGQKRPSKRTGREAGFFLTRLLTKRRSPNRLKGSRSGAGRSLEASGREFPDEPPRDPGEVYRSLVNHIGIGVFRTTPGVAGRFLEVNPAMERITGYSREELLKMNVADLYLHPEERMTIVGRVLAGGPPRPNEVFFKKKDGTVIMVRDTKVAVNSDDGRAVYLEGFLEDITERRRAEEAIRTSQVKLKSMLNSAHAGIGISVDQTIGETNPRLCEMVGYPEEELLGKRTRILYPDDACFEAARSELYKQLEERKYSTIETQWQKRSGELIDVLLNSAWLDPANPAQGIIFTALDITEHKKAEESLRLSDAALRSIHQGVIALDDKFVVTHWNEICEEMFGVKASDAIGKPIGESVMMVEQYPGQNKERVALLIARGYNREEQLYRCPAGEVWVDVHAQAIESGGKRYGWVTLVADATERKRAEEALRRSEEELKAIFQAVAEGVAVVDTNGVITRVNNALLAIFGLKSEDEVIGRHNHDLVAPEDDEKLRRSMMGVLERGMGRNIALTGLRQDGQRISIEMSASLLRDNAGRLVGSVVTVRDVTETRRMQEQLLAQNRLASIGELVSGVAHEINNPLTGVIGFSEILMQQDVPDHLRDDLAIILKEAKRAAHITKDLLTFARKHPATKQPAKIESILEDVLRLRAYEHAANNIEVVRHLAPDLPEVTVDYYQIQQVFLNIIVNAEYFMVEAHKRGTLTITGEVIDGMVRVSFADDGPGIPPANLSRIFDPFFTTKDIGKGTGLGLSICHGIVSEHRGRMYAMSEQGKGATLVVELPLNSPEVD